MIRVFLGTFIASVFVITLGLIALAAGGADSLDAYLVLAAILFAIGTFGFLARRNAISMLMSIELMLNAVNLSIVAFGAFVPGARRSRARSSRSWSWPSPRPRRPSASRSSSRSTATGRRRSSTSTTRCAGDRGPMIDLVHPADRDPAAGRLRDHRARRPAARQAGPPGSRSAVVLVAWAIAHGRRVPRPDPRRAVRRRGGRVRPRGPPLHVDPGRRLRRRGGLLRRRADRLPADRRDDDRHARPRLLDRLHEPRPGLLAVLRLPQPVHVLDAAARPRRQLPRRLRRLGAGRPVELPADRVLADRSGRRRSRRRRRSSSTASATSGSRSGSC